MARIRTIKPEFWEDETIADLPLEARLFFIGTWNFADDAGVIPASARWLKSKIFPFDDSLREHHVTTWVSKLVEKKMLFPFKYDGKDYYHIRTFKKHQLIDKRYAKFLVPPEMLDSIEFSEVPTCSPCEHHVNTSQEGIVKEGNSKRNNNSTNVLLSAEPTAQLVKSEWEELSKNLPADIRGQWESIKIFIEEKKPGFIHPYATIWNVFAGKYGLSQIKAVEGGRSRKFNVRIKEPTFDFLQILDGIRKSTFCRGENKNHWRVDWDWIMENGTNYLKIIENKYE